MRTIIQHTALAACLIFSQCQSLEGNASQSTSVTAFWRATSTAEQTERTRELLQAAPDVQTLYQWLQTGPEFSADVPRGQLDLVRTGPDDTQFPYVVLVPEDYNPAHMYPVEFNLHGGISRPSVEPGEPWWRQGYDSLHSPDRIVVVPAAWEDAFWWFNNQAENIPSILKSIKQTYNVDDNQVYLSGVSDGGTGTYFFAFMQPTEWAAFLPYIGAAAVLRNPAGRVSYALSFENLKGKALYVVNGENDPLYPAAAVQPYIDLMNRAGVEYIYRVIPNGGHNTAWLPEERPAIEQFKREHVRDPLPDNVQWVTNRTDRYNRNHWLRVDEIRSEGQPARVMIERIGNDINITNFYVRHITLLLSPEEIDFTQPVVVRLNGEIIHNDVVTQSAETLLKWATLDRDRSMLFTAELPLQLIP